jgi:hypothetical protein
MSALEEGDPRPDLVQLLAKRLGVTEQEVVDMNRRRHGDASLNSPMGEEGESGERQDFLVAESASQEVQLAENEETDNRRKALGKIEGRAFEKVQKTVKRIVSPASNCVDVDRSSSPSAGRATPSSRARCGLTRSWMRMPSTTLLPGSLQDRGKTCQLPDIFKWSTSVNRKGGQMAQGELGAGKADTSVTHRRRPFADRAALATQQSFRAAVRLARQNGASVTPCL